MQNLEGKTAFVTGGASGIGLGIAKALLKAGMNVAIADIRDDHLEEGSKELGGGDRAMAVKLDVTNREQYAAVADEVEKRFGKIHLLVNNAGVAVVGPVEMATYDDWDWTMGVNVGGVINGVVTMLPRILNHGEGGHIVSTASMSGLMPNPGTVIYTMSKAAVIGMCEGMRLELEGKNVIVSAFCPGPVQSNIAKAGETRPAEFSQTGYAEADKGRQQGDMRQHMFKTKEEIGEIVRAGIENDDLYILTHSEFTPGLKDRTEAMMAAIPDLPENEELKETYAILFQNPIHAAERDRQLAKKKS